MLQIPSSKFQREALHGTGQPDRTSPWAQGRTRAEALAGCHAEPLEFGCWSFFGARDLELGISPPATLFHRNQRRIRFAQMGKRAPFWGETSAERPAGFGVFPYFSDDFCQNADSGTLVAKRMACSTCLPSLGDSQHAHQSPPSLRRRTVHKPPPDASRAFPPASRSPKTTPAAAQAAAGCVFPLRSARGVWYSPAP